MILKDGKLPLKINKKKLNYILLLFNLKFTDPDIWSLNFSFTYFKLKAETLFYNVST